MSMAFGRASARWVPSSPNPNSSLQNLYRSIVGKLKSKSAQSFNAISDSYFSIKDVFERHKVVLTLAASLASAGAAWAGYAARQLHQKKVEARLDTIEHVMTSVHSLEERQVKELTKPGVSLTSCIATAGTTLVIGYGLGFRGGRFHALKKIQRQQQKLLTPKRSVLSEFRKQFKLPNQERVTEASEKNVSNVKRSI